MQLGGVPVVNVLLQLLVQPFASVTVTVYEPAANGVIVYGLDATPGVEPAEVPVHETV